MKHACAFEEIYKVYKIYETHEASSWNILPRVCQLFKVCLNVWDSAG